MTKPKAVTWKSLPNKPQLLILATCRLSEPLSNTTLLAYIYYLLQHVLSTKSSTPSNAEIARLSGLLVAIFPLGQFTTSLLWGWLSDVYGRKPVIVIGLLMSALANIAFGFSQSFGQLILWRCVLGLANGNTSVMRTMTAEIVQEKKYRARAFLLLPLIFNTGRVAAMGLGGLLADPVNHLPFLFGESGILNTTMNSGGVHWAIKYPYALPMLVNSTVIILSLLLAIIGLEETAPCKIDGHGNGGISFRKIVSWSRKIKQKTPLHRYSAIKLEEEQLETLQRKPHINSNSPMSSSILTRELLRALVLFALLPLHNAAFTHLFSVFLSTPVSTRRPTNLFLFMGGLGLSSKSVGLCMSLVGLIGILLKFLTYPALQFHLGSLKTLRLAFYMFPLAYLTTPYLAVVPQHSIWRWPAVISVLLMQIMARGFAIPSAVIILTDSAPCKEVLGTVHGAGNMLGSLSKSMAPVVGGWISAWGVESSCVGAAWWLWMTPIALLALIWAYLLTDTDDKDDLLNAES